MLHYVSRNKHDKDYSAVRYADLFAFAMIFMVLDFVYEISSYFII